MYFSKTYVDTTDETVSITVYANKVLFIRGDDVIETIMNIYDKKSVRCSKCDRFIGEIDYDAVVTLPKCGKCANPLPEGDDKVMYVISKFNKNPQSLTKPLDPTLA